MRSKLLSAVLVLAAGLAIGLAFPAGATTKHTSPPPTPAPQATKQDQAQQQAQGQTQGQQQQAEGGDAQAGAAATAGANADAGATSGSASESNGVQSITQTYQDAGRVATLILPSMFVQGCGAGIEAGAGNRHDVGAFGIQWTSAMCYAFMSVSNNVGFSNYEAACVLDADVNRAAYKRQNYVPDCKAFAVRVYADQLAIALARVAPPASGGNYVTREELREALGAMFKQSQAK